MVKRVAFADRSGNSSFDFESQGSHFIVATVICNAEHVAALERSVDEIRAKHHFQSGEL